MPGFKSRPRVGVIKPRSQIREVDGRKHYSYFLSVCIRDQRLLTVISCQASTALSKEQRQKRGPHICCSLVELEVTFVAFSKTGQISIKEKTENVRCQIIDLVFCLDNETHKVVVCYKFLFCFACLSLAKEILCLSHRHIQPISHKSGCFHSKITPLFKLCYLNKPGLTVLLHF